jgi:hypothetical protein
MIGFKFKPFQTFHTTLNGIVKMFIFKRFGAGKLLILLEGRKNQEEPKRHFYYYVIVSNDETSPINYAAQAIINLLSAYQLNKVPKLRRRQHEIRGVCILVYSPMKTTFGGSHVPRTQTVDANEDRIFTHQELYNIIEFHQTNSARKQYKGHDSPIHRTLDGMI